MRTEQVAFKNIMPLVGTYAQGNLTITKCPNDSENNLSNTYLSWKTNLFARFPFVNTWTSEWSGSGPELPNTVYVRL